LANYSAAMIICACVVRVCACVDVRTPSLFRLLTCVMNELRSLIASVTCPLFKAAMVCWSCVSRLPVIPLGNLIAFTVTIRMLRACFGVMKFAVILPAPLTEKVVEDEVVLAKVKQPEPELQVTAKFRKMYPELGVAETEMLLDPESYHVLDDGEIVPSLLGLAANWTKSCVL